MRSFKAKRKFLKISLPSSPVQDNNSNLSNNRKVVWVPTDSNDPNSPISVEYMPQRVKGKLLKGKTKKNSVLRMNKNIPTNSTFPFFIDKTPTAVKRKKRCLDMNDSVILLDTPSTSNKAPVESEENISTQTKKLVDMVDLCSDSEDEIETPKIGQKRKRTAPTLPNLNESVLEVSSPDIIILDEDDSDKNNTVIVKSTSDPLVTSISLSEKVKNTNSSEPDSTSFIGFSLNSSNFPITSLSELCKSKAPMLSNDFAPSNTLNNLHPSSTSVSNRSNLPPLPDFIPITLNTCSSSSIPLKVTSGSGKKSLPCNVGSNVFNPNSNVEQTGLRPIIIDGSNVAIAHGGDQIFSVRGLCICVEYFLRRGHTQVLAIVPLHQRCKVSPPDRHILDCLQKDKHLVFTPSRYIGKQLISSYDDRFIVQYAAAVGGVIVSRDNYRDLLNENPAWKDTILERLLMPTWVGDMLMFPVDPMGKKGPNLDEFLRFPKK